MEFQFGVLYSLLQALFVPFIIHKHIGNLEGLDIDHPNKASNAISKP